MKRTISAFMNTVVAAGLALLMTACGGGGGGGGGGSSSGGLSLQITDAPVDSEVVDEVWVRFTRVVVHSDTEECSDEFDVTTPGDPTLNYRDIELTQLSEGVRVLLGEFVLKPCDYQWVRLEVDLDGTKVVENGGGEYSMDCPSCAPEQSGLKLNRPFTIEEEGWVAWTIDFDLLKSLTRYPQYPNGSKNKYKLRPTLRIIDTELASAFIEGTVTDLRNETFTPTPDMCKVYVYEGRAADVVPDDICYTGVIPVACDPALSVPPGSGDRPLLEAAVVAEDDLAGGYNYTYKTGHFYPDSLDPAPADDTDPEHDGYYTVALLCVDPMDDPEVDENFTFIGEAEVYAETPGGYTHDFEIVDVAELSFEKTLSSNADEDSSGTVTPGDTLTYQFDASNTGNVTLNGVSISDPLAGLSVLSCNVAQPAVLAPGEALSCTATYVVQIGDIGTLSNTAAADSTETDPVESTVDTAVVAAPPI